MQRELLWSGRRFWTASSNTAPLPSRDEGYHWLRLNSDLAIEHVNRGYLRATLTDHDQIVGSEIFEAFPDNPGDPEADGVKNLSTSRPDVCEAWASVGIAPHYEGDRLGDASHSRTIASVDGLGRRDVERARAWTRLGRRRRFGSPSNAAAPCHPLESHWNQRLHSLRWNR
jgi:hypothetical protein